jgi:hypothetical protein
MRILSLIFLSFILGDINSVCRTKIERWPRWVYYKPIGSYHFDRADPRRFKLTVVLRRGTTIPAGDMPSCLSLLDPNGEVIAKLGRYSSKGVWVGRWYGPTGCGRQAPSSISGNINGCQLRKRLRDRGFRTNHVWAKFGETCVKISDVTKCGYTSTDPQCKYCECENQRWVCSRNFR